MCDHSIFSWNNPIQHPLLNSGMTQIQLAEQLKWYFDTFVPDIPYDENGEPDPELDENGRILKRPSRDRRLPVKKIDELYDKILVKKRMRNMSARNKIWKLLTQWCPLRLWFHAVFEQKKKATSIWDIALTPVTELFVL